MRFTRSSTPRRGRAIVFNGTGPAPAAATPERYAGGIPRTGPLSVSVPGMLAALDLMHRRFGRLQWRDLCAEAIDLARNGFGATRAYCHFAEEYRSTLLIDPRTTELFLKDGRPPPLGTPIVQPDLARTLKEIAADGADTFYRGPLSRRLASGLNATGALVAAADLAQFTAEEQAPLAIDYRGYTVLEAPPNSTGFVLLQELKILEHLDLAGPEVLSADRVHAQVEAKKLAFADRERWGADPRSLEAPFERLLSPEYTADLAARIDMRRAAPTRLMPKMRPATRPISALPTAPAMRFPASRASTVALAPASSPATPASCSIIAWLTGTSNPAIRTALPPVAACATR